MTTTLIVLTKPTTQPNVFDVYWACGRSTQGLLTVTMDCETEDNSVAAELSAMQYLLEVREVCGADRTGNSMQLTCSRGAVKKLANGKSDKAMLKDYALFLRTRFGDASIAVSKDESFIVYTRAHNTIDNVSIDGPLLSYVTMNDGLRVGVTHHALSVYQGRYQVPLMANAWRSLRAAMMHPSTRLQRSTPEEDSRHGKAVRAYVNTAGLRMIVVNDPAGAKLVSCYYLRTMAAREAQFA
jgi:hypothetical protein